MVVSTLEVQQHPHGVESLSGVKCYVRYGAAFASDPNVLGYIGKGICTLVVVPLDRFFNISPLSITAIIV